MEPRTIVILLAGAGVIVLSVSGLVEIGSRAGPYEEPFSPASLGVSISGEYLASPPRGTQGPGGICVPAGDACTPPRLAVDLSFSGLPRLGGDAAYRASLRDELGNALALGDLRQDGPLHRLQHNETRDAQAYVWVRVEAALAGASGPGLHVLSLDVAGKGRDAPHVVDASTRTQIMEGEGRVRVAEIGAASKSVTAVGELRPAAATPGWTYRAWFEPILPQAAWIALGELGDPAQASGPLRLDARVEHIRLEDQGRLVVTVEPADSERLEPGLPAFAARFPV